MRTLLHLLLPVRADNTVRLEFEEALKGLLETEPPKEKQEKKTPTKRRKRSTEKASDSNKK